MISQPTQPPPTPLVVLTASLAYFAALAPGLAAAGTVGAIPPVWLGPGLAIWLVVRFGPAMLGAVALGQLAAHGLNHPWPASAAEVGLGLAAMLGPVLTAFAGARLFHVTQLRCEKNFKEIAEPLACAAATLVGPMAAATLHAAAQVGAGGRSLPEAAAGWFGAWSGEAVGALFLLPLLLAVPELRQRWRDRGARDLARGAAVLVAMAAAGWAVLGRPEGEPYFFALFPLLLLPTVWFGAPGVRLAAFLLVNLGAVAAALGHGGSLIDRSAGLLLPALALVALALPVLNAWGALAARLPLVLLLGGWAASGLLFVRLEQTSAADDAAEFNRLAAEGRAEIVERVTTYVDALRGAASFLVVRPEASRREWTTFVEALDLPKYYPGVTGLAMVSAVRPEATEAFLRGVRSDGVPDFRIHDFPGGTPDDDRERYVVTYLTPEPANQAALGLDLASEPARRRAADDARDTGEPQLTSPVSLLQDQERRTGLLLFLPVYRHAAPVATVEQRRAALQAWVDAPFLLGPFLQSVLMEGGAQVHLTLFHGTRPDMARRLFSSERVGARAGGFERTSSLVLRGQRFTLGWNRGPAFVPDRRSALVWLAAFSGVGTVLLAGWAVTLLGARQRAEALAQQRTAALRESETRWKFAIVGSGGGLWDWDVAGGTAFFAPRWLELRGLADHEAGADFAEWEKHIHPDDRPAASASLQAALRGAAPRHKSEHRIRTHDGTWKWIVDRGLVVSRDPAGQPLRMIGTEVDITARKEAEEVLRENARVMTGVFLGAPTAIALSDLRTGEFIEVNDRYLQLVERPREALIGRRSTEIGLLKSVAEREQIMGEAARAGRIDRAETTLVMPDGREKLVGFSVAVVQIGSRRCALSYEADITERRATESALREREVLLSSINANLAGACIFRVAHHADGRLECLYISPNVEEFIGVPAASVLADGALVYSLIHPGDLAGARRSLGEAVRSSGPGSLVVRLRDPRGGERWMQFLSRFIEWRADGAQVRDGAIVEVTSIKAAEEALRAVRERLELALRAGRICTWAFEVAPNRVTFDAGWAELLGHPPGETVATMPSVIAAVHPDDRRESFAAAKRAIRGQVAHYHVEQRVATAQGGWRWILSHGQVTERLGDGRAVRIVGTNTDITARKAAEAELRHQSDFVAALHETTLDLLHRRDLPDLLQALVTRASHLLEATFAELVLKEGDALVVRAFSEGMLSKPGQRLGRAASPLSWQAIDTGRPVVIADYAAEAGAATRFGSLGLHAMLKLPVLRGAEPLGVLALSRREAGRPFTADEVRRGEMLARQAALVLHNATLRDEALREAEARTRALLETEERMALAVEATGLGLWVRDAASGSYWVSDRCRELCGFAPGEPVDLERLLGRVDAGDRANVQRAFARLLEAGESFEIEYRLARPDGTTRWVASRGQAELDRAGRPARAQGVSFDITRRRAAEQELAQHRAELTHLARVNTLGELSGSIAHELNQPLAIILSNAQAAQRLLVQSPPDIEEVRAILTDIVSEDHRAGQVIQRLRRLLKQGEVHLQALQMNGVVNEVLHLARSDLISRWVNVHCQLAEEAPAVAGDPVQLQQVLLNLVLNACDAMERNAPRDRHLHLATARHGDMVRVSVRDCGCGLPAGDPEQIFRPFFTTKAAGLGLGLGICRSILAACGGRLWAEPNPAGGVTLHFELSIVPPAAP